MLMSLLLVAHQLHTAVSHSNVSNDAAMFTALLITLYTF